MRVLAAADLGFRGTNDTVAADTWNLTGASFDQCAFAAGLGYVDICVAEFGLTAERRSATDFYTVEGVAMCAAPGHPKTRATTLTSALLPHRTGTWSSR